MSAGIDKEIVLRYYQGLSDDQIINVLTKDVKGLTAEALEIVKSEINRRNLDPLVLKAVELQQQTDTHVQRAYDADGCPVEEETRIWLERSFLLLLDMFGEQDTINRTVLVPDSSHFPVIYDGSEKSVFESLKIV